MLLFFPSPPVARLIVTLEQISVLRYLCLSVCLPACLFVYLSLPFCLSVSLSVTCLVLHSVHFKHWNSARHVILWKTAFVGGDKAHVPDANTTHTNSYTLTHCLSQITWTIRSFKRISQWEGAALESHAPDGYWSIISLPTDKHAKQALLLLFVIVNKLVTLLLQFFSVLRCYSVTVCAFEFKSAVQKL